MKSFSEFVLENKNPYEPSNKEMEDLLKQYKPSPEERERRAKEQNKLSREKAENIRKAVTLATQTFREPESPRTPAPGPTPPKPIPVRRGWRSGY